MDFKQTVKFLLERDERPISWLGKKLGKTRQNMHSHMKTNNPTVAFRKEVAAVFNMAEIEFIKVMAEEK